jgi:hypothetical protein
MHCHKKQICNLERCKTSLRQYAYYEIIASYSYILYILESIQLVYPTWDLGLKQQQNSSIEL